MNFKKIFDSMFAYSPPVDYNFSLPEDSKDAENNDNQSTDTSTRSRGKS